MNEARRLAVIGVVTVSDRASAGIYEDKGGPAIEAYFARVLVTPYRIERRVIPDGFESVRDTLIDLADTVGCDLVVTTGGTGPSPRDLTPEATLAACPRELPGFGELMRQVSLSQTPTAILSRQLAAHRGKCLVINLPGKPAAIASRSAFDNPSRREGSAKQSAQANHSSGLPGPVTRIREAWRQACARSRVSVSKSPLPTTANSASGTSSAKASKACNRPGTSRCVLADSRPRYRNRRTGRCRTKVSVCGISTPLGMTVMRPGATPARINASLTAWVVPTQRVKAKRPTQATIRPVKPPFAASPRSLRSSAMAALQSTGTPLRRVAQATAIVCRLPI